MSWLDHTIVEVAQSCGFDARDVSPTPDERREILDIARLASHSSGERINAPLLCYVLGVAHGRGVALEDLAAAVRAVVPDVDAEKA